MRFETQEYLESLEQEFSGPIRFKTYANFLGFSTPERIEKGGLLFVINDTLYFEDFERKLGLLDLVGLQNREVYQKFRTSCLIRDISAHFTARTAAVKQVIKGYRPLERIRPTNIVVKSFVKTCYVITLTSGPSWFMEVLDDTEFHAFLKGEIHESVQGV